MENPQSNASARGRIRKPHIRHARSVGSPEWVGFGILAIGVLAVIGVGVLVYQKLKPSTALQAPVPAAAVSAPDVALPPQLMVREDSALQNRVAKDLMTGLAAPFSPDKNQYKKPKTDGLYFARGGAITESDVAGRWQTIASNSTAVLELASGTYQIVMADPNNYSERKYSRGTYRFLDDMIVFEPHNEWPKPNPPKGTDVEYHTITASQFPAVVGFQRGYMLWQNAPQTERRVYIPRVLPILEDPAQGYLVWERMK